LDHLVNPLGDEQIGIHEPRRLGLSMGDINPEVDRMCEKEKMLSGRLYDGFDSLLLEERTHARILLKELNQRIDVAARKEVIKRLFGRIGSGFWIEPPFYCDYGYNIEVGNQVFINFDCVFIDCNKIEIGDNVQIAPKVQIYTATHPVNAEQRIKGPEYALPVKIRQNCWIGGGAIILPGVKIGEGTTIAAGSVVVKDIPAEVLAAGNPCRVIREL
jgi:maltose O-acetyltransferase